MNKILKHCVTGLIILSTVFTFTACGEEKNTEPTNETLMQGFDWEVQTTPALWTVYSEMAEELSTAGVTSIWIPPAYKCSVGINSVGYDPYDYYDLGEFDQKGTVRTKYGTADELKKAVKDLHSNDIKVIADTILNHMYGGDVTETIEGMSDLPAGQTNQFGTGFTYSARNNKYSSFKWNWNCFDAIGIGGRDNESPFLFPGKGWDDTFDVDYLGGLDIDYQNSEVRTEMCKWGEWFVNTADLDGFRLDAVKYIDKGFLKQWLDYVREKTGKKLWTVGEAWIENADELGAFVDATEGKMNVFDFELYDIFNMCQSDLSFSRMSSFGLVNTDKAQYAVTFVNNHDTYRPSEGLEGIQNGKEFYYAYILTLDKGTPCVFWKDYAEMKANLTPMMQARRNYAYGAGKIIEVDREYYVYQREGTNKRNGLIVVMSANEAKSCKVIAHPNTTYYDIMGNSKELIKTSEDGEGEFFNVEGGKVSIWVPQN